MYQCGHTYHQVCLNIEQNASPLCPICNKVEDKFKRGVAEQGTTPQAAGVQARDAERRKKLDRLEQFAIKERYSERPRSVVVSGEARRSGSQLTLAPPTAQAHIIPRRFPGRYEACSKQQAERELLTPNHCLDLQHAEAAAGFRPTVAGGCCTVACVEIDLAAAVLLLLLKWRVSLSQILSMIFIRCIDGSWIMDHGWVDGWWVDCRSSEGDGDDYAATRSSGSNNGKRSSDYVEQEQQEQVIDR